MTLRPHRFALIAVLCAMLACVLLAPGLGGGFILDDDYNITLNPLLHVTAWNPQALFEAAYSFTWGGGPRFLPMLSFALDHWRAGLDPAAFKATNLGIHALTVVVLAGFLRCLLQTVWPAAKAEAAALAIALAWAIHPLQVSAVLYVVQRMQTMCTLFILLALWAYLLARKAQIRGARSRRYWLLAMLCGALAFASKEDAVLLPVYAFALELTVLRFRTADTLLARRMRNIWLVLAGLGVAAYLLVALPHYWTSEQYWGMGFNSYERLLTQGRVLVMYLGQILVPVPDHMRFYYDGMLPSHDLMHPPSTAPCLAALAALLLWAWSWRKTRPLFALGILLFFAGHFITSGAFALDMAFEHRNHFPLIGILLALADLLDAALGRLHAPRRAAMVAASLSLCVLAIATGLRAHTWGDPLRLAEKNAQIAPDSARAWMALCNVHYVRSADKPGPELDLAISACRSGSAIPYAAYHLANIVIFKTMRGDVSAADWDRYLDRLQHGRPSAENINTIWVLIKRKAKGLPLDENGVLKAIDIVARRDGFMSVEYARIGYFILDHTQQPDMAYLYFEQAVRASSPKQPVAKELIADLRSHGRQDWAAKLEAATGAAPAP